MSCNAKFNKAGQEGTLSRPDRLNIITGVFLKPTGDQNVALSFEIAKKIAYRNSGGIGIQKAGAMDCTMAAAAPVLPAGYVVNASRIADRRKILVGYRLADLLTRLTQN